MNRTLRMLLCVMSLMLSTAGHARDQAIINWVQGVLLETLTFSYNDQSDSQNSLRTNFTYNAQSAISSFLGNYRQKVISEEMILQPQLNGPGQIIRSGIVNRSNFFNGIHYWQVQQAILMPKLDLNVTFTALVIELKANRYIIASLNMTLNQLSQHN